MQELQPQVQELQKRYKNDKDKLNQEMVKLYQENKANPAGGCAPTLIQMPILISLYWVIQQPLKYMLGKTPEIIQQLFDKIPAGALERIMNMKDISIINYFTKNVDQLAGLENLLKPSELINLNFLGILNLGMQPSFDMAKLTGPLSVQYIVLLFIPILAAVSTYFSIVTSSAQTAQSQAAGNQMQKSMTTIMPFITGFFAFSVPAGLGLYWIVSNVFQVLQQWYMNKYVIQKKEVAKK
jgi:YidC/Oxa1 family membrane protein insertase